MKTFFSLLICALLAGCGSGSSTKTNPLQAISNGATLAAATSYWACEDCAPGYVMGIEFATNGSFQTIITGSGPGSTTCTGTVTYPPGQPAGTELILGGSCSGGTDSIETLGGLTGSISDGGFSALSTTVSMNQDATYNACSFTLVQGQQGASQ